MARVLYAGDPRESAIWANALRAAKPDIDLAVDPSATDPREVDILLYEPTGPVKDLAVYAGIAAIQNLWAGVESLLSNPTLPDGPALLRMVEDGLTFGMTDYVTGHVLRLHLGMDGHRASQARRAWEAVNPPLSSDRTVGVVGLGVLGSDAASMLSALRFRVLGWSRRPKVLPGVTCLHGEAGFGSLLQEAEILVLLAPLTPQTERLIDSDALARMRPGAHLVNVARGPLIDDDALLAALDSGHLASATLDVFRDEPLPADHRYWGHPSVTVTPHIASVTRPETAARVIVSQIERFDSGRPFDHLVDRDRGY